MQGLNRQKNLINYCGYLYVASLHIFCGSDTVRLFDLLTRFTFPMMQCDGMLLMPIMMPRENIPLRQILGNLFEQLYVLCITESNWLILLADLIRCSVHVSYVWLGSRASRLIYVIL